MSHAQPAGSRQRGPGIRSCVICRRRGEMGALVPLRVGTAGALEIGRPARGRGAWMCPRRRCMEGMLARRGRGIRGFPELVSVDGLPALLEAHLLERAISLLRSAQRSGLCRSGARAMRRAVDDGRACIIVRADPCGRRLRSWNPGVPVEVLPLPPQALGQVLGTGPRSGVAVVGPGVASSIGRQLRLLRELG